jgi:glycosyltransferase involved in cell wall biosynthesis
MDLRVSGKGPRVSLGMPVVNDERYLEEALGSLLGQSFDDFEFVISDNASTDRTGDICRAYATKDERINFRMRQNYVVMPTRVYQSWALPEAL